jgi:rhodanese-related sulfurtransferase
VSSATFLEWARVELNRVDPHEADQLHRDGGLLVDIRPHHTRLADGEIPGAVAVERLVLEWRLDPFEPSRLRGLTPDTPVVVFCTNGTASSLAARDLKRIGLRHATDLIGGYRGWVEAGLPTRAGATEAVN